MDLPFLAENTEENSSLFYRPYNNQRRDQTILPLELIFDIFERAAGSSNAFWLSLCLVSSWARHFALPHLLRTVVLRTKANRRAFQEYISRNTVNPSPNFLHATSLHNLWLPAEPSPTFTQDIFQVCQNLTSIALSGRTLAQVHRLTLGGSDEKGRNPKIIMRDRNLHVTVLNGLWSFTKTITAGGMMGNSPLLDMVTHLRYVGGVEVSIHTRLPVLPHLTHLAISYSNMTFVYMEDDFYPFAEGALLNRPALQAFVLVLYMDESTSQHNSRQLTGYHRHRAQTWVRRLRASDPRVYMLESHACDVQDEWLEEVSGGVSIWQRAVSYTKELEDEHHKLVA